MKKVVKKLNNRVNKLDIWDIILTKLAVAVFVLFFITVWPAVVILVYSFHWIWLLGAALILAIRPLTKVLRR